MKHMDIWETVKHPPKDVLKKIEGGRLKGMTDIKPQWRYEELTKMFGPIGFGWYFTISKTWVEDGHEEKTANAIVELFIKDDSGGWSRPIYGIGGSKLVAKEAKGPYTSDECFKMAVTDALGTACKCLGFGADIYYGAWDGSKYHDRPAHENADQRPAQNAGAELKPGFPEEKADEISEEDFSALCTFAAKKGYDKNDVKQGMRESAARLACSPIDRRVLADIYATLNAIPDEEAA